MDICGYFIFLYIFFAYSGYLYGYMRILLIFFSQTEGTYRDICGYFYFFIYIVRKRRVLIWIYADIDIFIYIFV